MLRIAGALVAAATLLIASTPVVATAAPTSRRLARIAPASELVGFGSRFGGAGLRRGYGYGYYRRPRYGFFRRAVRTVFWLYVLHLFFSHGGLSLLLWMVILAVLVSLLRGRRRRRFGY